MAYIETKTVGGREYMYLRHSVRLPGGRIVHKNVRYLGPVKPVYKRKRKRRDNSRIFVRKLTDDEKHVLEKGKSSPAAFTRDRARIILFSSERLSCLSIAGKLNCDVRKVRKTIKEFNERGIACLERGKAKGAEPKFTREQRAKMLEIASTDPVKLGQHYTTWSLRKLKRYFEGEEVVESISTASIRTILKTEGMNWRKSKRFQYSNDPEFAKKNFESTG